MSQDGKDETRAPLKLPDWWPGATRNVRFPTDDSLPSSAKALRGHLDALDIAMRGIAVDGRITAEDVGNWDVGRSLHESSTSAQTYIGGVLRRLRDQLEVAARLLVTSHESHDNAEHASTRDARRVGGEIPDTPAAHPTRQSTPSID